MSRTSKSIHNIIVAVASQVILIITGFAARKIFVIYLNAEYLGLNGLFSSILTVLSLTELGLGPAMIFSLYKPLAEENFSVCRSLMDIYRKAYRVIGSVVLVVGCCITPFIQYLIKDIPENVTGIHIIYIMFVINTAISYFFSYKRSIITASQNQYLINEVHAILYLLMNIIQILLLVLTQNYYLFLGVQILSTFIENIILSINVDRIYPWLRAEEKAGRIPQEIRDGIIRNVKAMIFHRIGGIISDAIDNILISKFFGLLFLGLYSNYLLILNAVNSITRMFFTSITASIGNFGVEKSYDDSYVLYRKIQFFNFWLASFSSISIFVLMNPFIDIFWLGKDYLISMEILAVVVLNFYINNMRNTILTFKEAFGLPWYDRYKPLVGAAVNLTVSIFLANRWGVIGVFIGTTITQLFVNVWVEAYVVFRHGFQKPIQMFLKEYIIQNIVFITSLVLTCSLCSFLSRNSFWNFIMKILICIIVPNGLICIIYGRTHEFQYVLELARQLLKKIRINQ